MSNCLAVLLAIAIIPAVCLAWVAMLGAIVLLAPFALLIGEHGQEQGVVVLGPGKSARDSEVS